MAFTASLAAARLRVELANDQVVHISRQRQSVGVLLEEAGERLGTLAELYDDGYGAVGLRRHYLRQRDIYRNLQEQHFSLIDGLRRAEQIFQSAVDEERMLLARVEALRRRAAAEQGNGYPSYMPGYRYVSPDWAEDRDDGRRRYSEEPRRAGYDESRSSPRQGYSTRSSSRDSRRTGEESDRDREQERRQERRQERPRERRQEYRRESRQEYRPRQTAAAPNPSQTQHRPRPSDSTVTAWWREVNEGFKDVSNMERFPTPPACTFCDEGHCDASVKALFRRVPGFNVKKERVRWHPDRFSACKADKREDFKKKAEDVFVALDEMLKEEREKEQRKREEREKRG